MRMGMACAIVLATTSLARAEAQQARPNPPAQLNTPQAVPRPTAPVKAVEDTANEHGRQLTACFNGIARKVTMIVVVSYDGAKLRSSVKQSSRATKQLEACVVNVFDHIAFRWPDRPITIELPVEYTPATAGV